MTDFQKQILEGIPAELPEKKPYDASVNHAPRRKDILTDKEKALALKNAAFWNWAPTEVYLPDFTADGHVMVTGRTAQAAVTVQGAVSHHVLQRLRVPGQAQHLIFIALEMPPPAGADGFLRHMVRLLV